MHREVLNWLKETKENHPELFVNKTVIEAGSLDVNGSPRQFFEGGEYIGVDARNGKGVDHWGLFHEYKEKPFKYFDVAVSCETLEHDPFWKVTLRHMVDFIKPGSGVLLISCAGPARGPHGVSYYKNEETGGEKDYYHPLGPEHDYYWNLKAEILLYELFCISGWRKLEWKADRNGSDLCVVAMEPYRQPTNYNWGEVAQLRQRGLTKI